MPAGTNHLRTLASALLLCCAAAPVCAGKPDMDDFQLSLLPRWCHLTSRNTIDEAHLPPEELAKAHGYFKSGCSGLHHYCWALTWTNLGHFPNPENKSPPEFYYGQAIGDYDYVLERSQKGCKLLPDIHTKIGALEAIMGNSKKAEKQFHNALSLNPGYIPAFAGLSDLYETQGDIDKARTVLGAGIKANPQSGALKKKLARLQARTGGTALAP